MRHVAALSTDEGSGLHLAVAAKPESLGEIRRALEGLGLPDLMLRDAVLLTTELVSNSVRHAGLDSDDLIQVSVVRSGPTLHVSVRDAGTWAPPDPQVIGSIRPRPGAQSGWGLYLVDKLAVRWGTNVPSGGFWFELEERERRRRGVSL
jgi:anti-sigma regulatory factor (Ser/Thr protein kinase)